jgi:folate-binding protein YgfZ
MSAAIDALPLEPLGALRIRGADASGYLQGQLSADLRRAVPGAINYSGLHNPQGRVLARLALAQLAGDDWLVMLPATLVEPIAVALRRFVLRSRVTIDAAAHVIALPSGAGAGATPTAAALPAGAVRLQFPDGRSCLFLPEGLAAPAAGTPDASAAAAAWRDWQAREVALGLAEVYPETSGAFVAQMLNLDCVGAIAFDKGCYTGQEVIARAHYRGRVKRRLQRFAAPAPLGLAPGTALRLADGRSAQLVREALLPDGSCEFLAVCPLPGAQPAAAPGEAAPAGADATDTAGGGAASAVAVASRALPLPYALPE